MHLNVQYVSVRIELSKITRAMFYILLKCELTQS